VTSWITRSTGAVSWRWLHLKKSLLRIVCSCVGRAWCSLLITTLNQAIQRSMLRKLSITYFILVEVKHLSSNNRFATGIALWLIIYFQWEMMLLWPIIFFLWEMIFLSTVRHLRWLIGSQDQIGSIFQMPSWG
jgi:hypothetical protein